MEIVPANEKIHIFVKTLDGYTTLAILPSNASVLDLKKIIFEKQLKPIHKQRLLYGGKCLADDNTLDQYGIKNEWTVYLIDALSGC